MVGSRIFRRIRSRRRTRSARATRSPPDSRSAWELARRSTRPDAWAWTPPGTGEIVVEGELGRRRALAALKLRLMRERETGRTVVFTNGVFDPLRASHVDFLRRAKSLGDLLVVGVNSDQGARRSSLRGP